MSKDKPEGTGGRGKQRPEKKKADQQPEPRVGGRGKARGR